MHNAFLLPQRWVLTAVILSVVLIPINSTMIAVGLVPIAQGLNVPVASVIWVVTAYLVLMAALQPVSGKMGDMFGRRRLLMVGLSTFVVFSILAALSPYLWALLIFRSGQALGGAIIVPNAMGIIRINFVQHELRRALGLVGMIQGMGAAIGPLLGAALISLGGWTAIFWINVPLSILALILAQQKIVKDAPSVAHRVDIAGAATLAGFLVLLALSVPHAHTAQRWLATAPAALIVLGLFVWRERHAAEPIIRFPLFLKRPFLSANLAILLSNFFMYSTLLYMPLYLRHHGYGGTVTGLLLFVFSLCMSLMSWAGSYAQRFFGSRRIVALAFAIDLIAIIWYIGLRDISALDYIMAGLVVAGLGCGVGMVSMQATALESVAPELAGVSSGIYSTFRYIGSITASASIALMVAHESLHWGILGIATMLGLIVSQGLPGGMRAKTTRAAS